MNQALDKETHLKELRAYAKLLDAQFTIPKTKFTFGIDPLLSLIPFLGSFSGLLTGSVLIFLAHRKGVAGKAKVKMFKNLIIDFLFGLVPIAGNIKDFFYKANLKNMQIIEEHYLENKHTGSGWGLLILYILALLIVSIGFIFLFLYLLKMFLGFLFF